MAAFTWFRNGGAGSAGRDAAIHQQRLAGDVAAGFRGEKDDSAIEIVDVARPLHRNAIDQIVDPLLIFVKDLILGSAKPPWREAVDGDAVRPPIIGKAHGELAHTAAAGAIRRESRIAKDAGDG